MLVSIIIPVYKVELYIERCLLSVINQVYSDIEIILVDDCTPDSSMQIISEIVSNISFKGDIRYVKHTKNRGLSAARNSGIEIAKGEYIYFLDSDDEITPDCIQLLVEQCQVNKVDFVIGNYSVIGSDKEYPPLKLEDKSLVMNDDVLSSYLRGDWYQMAVNKLVNRFFLLKKNLYFVEGAIHEDELWSFMLSVESKSFSVVNKSTYNYYIREGSITTGPQIKNIISSIEIYQKMIQYVAKMELLGNKEIIRFLNCFAFSRYLSILNINIKVNEKFYYYKKIKEMQSSYPCLNCRTIKEYFLNLHIKMPLFCGYTYLFFLSKKR